jgi:hypothetical protein
MTVADSRNHQGILNQAFAWHTAAIEASPYQGLAFHQDGCQPFLGSPDGGGVSSWAATNDKKITFFTIQLKALPNKIA